MGAYLLVVESDGDLQARMAEALAGETYEVASEVEASWARRSIAVRVPDLLVLDTVLSDGPAFALADELRDNEETRALPIVFIASRGFRGAEHRFEISRRYAPADYLILPKEIDRLRDRLGSTLALGGGSSPLDGAEGEGRDGALTEPHEMTWTLASEDTTETSIPRAASGPARHAGYDPAQEREREQVEHTARALEQREAPVRGTLKQTPFARILQQLFAHRTSGSLLLTRDETKKIVSFTDGYPLSVRSNVLAECLGQILLQQRLITPEALRESLRRMKAEGRHQGQILVEMGALSPYNLSRALIEQVESKLFDIFAWPEGSYLFTASEEGAPEALRLDRAPAALILEGIRRHYDPVRRELVLAPFAGRFVKLNTSPTMRLQEVTSSPMERELIAEIDGTRRLESLLSSASLPLDRAQLLLVALAEAGIIEPSEQPVSVSALPPGSSELAGSSGSTPTPTAADGNTTIPGSVPETSLPLTTSQLALVAQTVSAQNHNWVLGVQLDDSTEVVDRAYEALARSFHSDRYRHRSPEDRRLAQHIFDRLAEAHRVLSRSDLRRAYVEAERDGRPTSAAAAAATPRGAAPAGAEQELYETGMKHLGANRHRQAVEAFRQAARMLPNHAEFRAALGWALFREAPADARAARAAQAELRRALQLDPKHRRARFYLGHLHAQTGQPELAIQEFEKIVELEPGAGDALDELRRLRERTQS